MANSRELLTNVSNYPRFDSFEIYCYISKLYSTFAGVLTVIILNPADTLTVVSDRKDSNLSRL